MNKYERQGDKKNSDFFEEYLQKIYRNRKKNGINELFERIRAILIQVDHGDSLKYLMELYLMTPYRFDAGYISDSHKIFILKNKPDYPVLIVLEPTAEDYSDEFTAINSLYPRSLEKPNARYLGEIFQTKNSRELRKILSAEEIRFQDSATIKNNFLANKNFIFSQISYFTNNIIGYTDHNLHDFSEFGLGQPFTLSKDEEEQLEKAEKVHQHFGLHELIHGVDHLATRVLSNEREHAILEFLTMTNHYFWGAFDIEEMNSSTNITRNPDIDYELKSPAKVFTANNTPFYTKAIDRLPSPTEDFVRNFGKRMHHMAYEVEDGEREDGQKNIDYVVGKLISAEIPFLAEIIGECKDFPDLKQIFSKTSKYSLLITEYVQRCKGFQGFFTKSNVAFLTQAAGEDEKLKKSAVYD